MSNANGITMHEIEQLRNILIKSNNIQLELISRVVKEEQAKRNNISENMILLKQNATTEE